MTEDRAKFRIYEAKNGEHWWRLVESNGRIIADSGEGYDSKAGAKAAVFRLRTAISDAELEVEGEE